MKHSVNLALVLTAVFSTVVELNDTVGRAEQPHDAPDD
jgi:hypothetical protein